MLSLHKLTPGTSFATPARRTRRFSPSHPEESAQLRLEMLRKTFAAAIREHVTATYPAVSRIVGRRHFTTLVERFMTAFPPRTIRVPDQGAGFSGFLATQAVTRTLPFLPDVARLEWAISLASTARPVPALPVDALDEARSEGYRHVALIFAPSCQLLASRHPILEIYRATLPMADPIEFLPAENDGVRLLLQRGATRLSFRGLDVPEYRFLSALRAGRSILEAKRSAGEGIEVDIALARLLAGGSLVGYARRSLHAHE